MKTFKDWVLFLCVVGLVICFIYIHTLSLRIDFLHSDNGNNYGVVTVTEEWFVLARSGLPARSTTTNCTK